jgi:DNA-binding transcriptional ArsR family regulator
LFGNEKTAEVVRALKAEGTATAQQITTRTGIAHSMVSDALKRLVQGEAVRALPKAGGSRSAQYYQPIDGHLWDALVAAVEALLQDAQLRDGSSSRT